MADAAARTAPAKGVLDLGKRRWTEDAVADPSGAAEEISEVERRAGKRHLTKGSLNVTHTYC